jgi:phospholipid transport system substrate-binding protein
MLRKFILIFSIYIAIASSAFAATTDNARQFVDEVGQKVIVVIDSPNKNQAQKQAELRQMFLDNVDIMWVSRFVLGPGWQSATPDQQSRYVEAYKKYMVAIYTVNFSEYTGSKYNIIEVRDEGNNQFTVRMQIKIPKQQQPETIAGYRLIVDNKGNFKIVDIIVEGVSLIATQRSEFGSVLRQSGIEGLIKALENKAVQAEKNPQKKSS